MSTSYTQTQKILANDGFAGDLFGQAAALSTFGHTALIGAPNGTGISSNTGCTYVLRLSDNQLVPEQKLIASDGAAGDNFGIAVTLSHDGKTALVGASKDDIGSNSDQGSAYVFIKSDNNTWIFQQKLIDTTGGSDNTFGSAVALSADGNRALIGAPGGKTIFFFTKSGTTWTQEQLDGPGVGQYGFSVAVSSGTNDQLKWVVGNPEESSGGVIHVFQRSGSSWVQSLHSPLLLQSADIAVSDRLGHSVAISHDGKTIIGGAPRKNGNQGAAYAFTLSDTVWSQQYKFLPSDVVTNDQLGSSVALGKSPEGHDVALIGAPGGNKSYVFKRISDVWTQFQTIRANDSDVSGNFGAAVALAGHGLIGMVGASAFSGNQGGTYLFSADHSVTPAPGSNTPLIRFLPQVLIGTIALYTGIMAMFLHEAREE